LYLRKQLIQILLPKVSFLIFLKFKLKIPPIKLQQHILCATTATSQASNKQPTNEQGRQNKTTMSSMLFDGSAKAQQDTIPQSRKSHTSTT
jgi:hypothetical protein